MRTNAAVIAALLVLVVALSPTLLLGGPVTPTGLVLTGGLLIGGGLLLRRAANAGSRTPGTVVAVLGGVLLAVGLGLIVLLVAG